MLDLRNLKYAVTVAKRLSFARAAEELGLSQPALTRAVQLLEQRYGVRLFDRDRSGVRLTPQGQMMLDAASALLANAEDVERQWDRTAKGQFGIARFGMAPMPARALLPAALAERVRTAPGVLNDVVVRNVEALWPLLTAGEIEFLVAAEGQLPDTVPVRTEVLGRFPRNRIVRLGHPLLAGPADEAGFPALVSGGVRMPRSSELEDGSGRPRHVVEDFEALIQITVATDAIWHCSAYAVKKEIERGLLASLPMAGSEQESSFRVIMYSLERRTLSNAATAFMQLFRSRIRELAVS